jgi:Mg/Co/Ni transporter MgtE
MSVIDIMSSEAEKGNAKATKFLLQITSNPEELSKVFGLINPNNRYLILQNMNQDDLMMVMQYLDPEELILGLSIFTQDAILSLMLELPPETLSKLVLENMDSDKFLKIIPEEYMDEFLTSDKIDRNMMMKAMESIDEEQLQKMMENVTGQPCYDERDTILEKMNSLSDDNFMRSVMSFEVEGKQQLISGLLQEKPELFQEFSAEAMVFPFTQMEKNDILKSLTVLETKEMLPMVEELPQEIMALIATQIDPEVFSEILTSNFADVIANCGINMG